MKVAHLLLVTMAIVLVADASRAQIGTGNNAPLMSRFDPPGAGYNDVWGYVSPSGGEYAILGATNGTYIVDCSDPSNPVQRGFFGGPSSAWRDMRTYRDYVYVVTEGGSGTQIIDLSDPDNPSMNGTWGQSFWGSAHNVAIDTGAGVLYACGTNQGVQIVDLSQNPTNPTLIGGYNIAYVHDLHVQDGYAHLGEFNSSRYRILDVTNPAGWQILGNGIVSACHNVWPTRDGRNAVATSEKSGGGMTIFNITNKSQPTPVAFWKTGGGFTSVHNAFLKDRVVHASYYSEGYVALDLGDARNPISCGAYDTTSSTFGFSGAWGCFPFLPSGMVYMSDQSNGLHVLDSKASSARYGTGTDGVSGTPVIYPRGAAFFGNANFGFEVEGAAPNSTATLIVSAGSTAINVQGLDLLVDLGLPHLAVSVATDVNGYALVGLPLGNGLPQVTLYAQFLVNDVAGPLGLSSTQGLQVEFYKRSVDS